MQFKTRTILLLFALSVVFCVNSVNLFSFQVGEKLTFDIKYGIIGAGQATLQVEEMEFRDQIPAYQIVSTARTNRFFDRIFRVRDEIESIIDRENYHSLRFTKRLHEGRYRQHRTHYYYPEQDSSLYLKYSFARREFDEEMIEIPPDTQDILSAFYWFRTQEAVPGDTLRVNVTTDGDNYVANILVHRTETIDTIFGRKECLVIEPDLEGEAIFRQTGNILIWVTNDEHKIPVKLQSRVTFGHFTATLSGAVNVPYQ